MKLRFLSSPLYNLELSKSPQSSSICNHNLARGDLRDPRLSGQAIYVLGPLQIDVSDQVHLDHEPELVPRVEESTPSLLVYLDPQWVRALPDFPVTIVDFPAQATDFLLGAFQHFRLLDSFEASAAF
jgi:hypothetical protein